MSPRIARVVLYIWWIVYGTLAAFGAALVVDAIAAPAAAQSVDPLTSGLEAALDGRVPNPVWRTNPSYCGSRVQELGERGSPSANWPTLACATAYVVGEPWARGWWVRYLTEAEADLGSGTGRLWGKEPGSRVYARWIVVPVLVVRDVAWQSGDTELVAIADKWLRASWALMALGSCDAPERTTFVRGKPRWGRYTSTLAGARSFSRRPVNGSRTGNPQFLETNEIDVIFARALGHSYSSGWGTWAEQIDRRLKAPAPERYGLTAGERSALRRLIKKGDNVDQVLPWTFGSVAPFRIRKTADGAATWMPRSRGSSATAPLPAKTCDNRGNYSAAAPDPGNRHDISMGTADIQGNWIETWRGDGKVSPLGWPPERPGKIKLPGGDLVYDVIVDKQGGRLWGTQPPPRGPPSADPPPGPTAQPPTTIDWQRVAKIAFALERQARAMNERKARNRVCDAARALGLPTEGVCR